MRPHGAGPALAAELAPRSGPTPGNQPGGSRRPKRFSKLPPAAPMAIQWNDWDEQAFAAARETHRPLFLFLFARWCRFSRELETRVLADPLVQELVSRNFVCVRVDKDRRPDVDARYSAGGWPTLAILDDSLARIALHTFVEAPVLIRSLELVVAHYAERPQALRRRLHESTAQTEVSPGRGGAETAGAALSEEPVEWVARTLLETADPVHGGWGGKQKFPHPEAIDFALLRWSETGDESMRKLVLRTLRNMQHGEIHDRIEGGFYRFATARDWSGPHYEKTLDSNATRAEAYLQAHQALGEESFAATALGVLEWMMARLHDPAKHAFRGSQDADPAYAHLTSLSARRERTAPEVDPTIFAGANALAASAMFRAGIVLRDERWTERAVAVLEFLLEELFDERYGVHHYWDGAPRLSGLLVDQAQVLRALVDAAQSTGDSRWLDPARSLVNVAVRDLRGGNGAFFDGRQEGGGRGALPRREQSIVDNSLLAETLLRLEFFTGDSAHGRLASEALGAFAGDYRRHGHFVAGYARAVALHLHPPVHVTIVARRSDPLAAQLRRAALEPYVASLVVQTVDMESGEAPPAASTPTRIDQGPWSRLGLAEGWRGCGFGARAFVQRGRESYAETSDPTRLPALMARIERGQ